MENAKRAKGPQSEQDEMKPRYLRRIIKDYVQLLENPLPGIAIAQINNSDYLNYIVNIEIIDGIYNGVKQQMILKLDASYPNKAPRINLMSGQFFRYPYHHHVFSNILCMDILRDAWMDPNTIGSGWTSAYTFTTLLLQLQSFLADPDIPKSQLSRFTPSVIKEKLLDPQMGYTNLIEINGKKIKHTWANPFPAFPKFDEQKQINNANLAVDKTQFTKLYFIKEKLTCYILKENLIDFQNHNDSTTTNAAYQIEDDAVQQMVGQHGDNDDAERQKRKQQERLALGYPIDLTVDDFGRLHPVPIPEILSYIGYKYLVQANCLKLDQNGIPISEGRWNTKFKSGFGFGFNSWMPIYINREHFEENLRRIKVQLAIVKYGNRFQEKDFQAGIIFEVFPTILNKLVVYLLDGTVRSSIAALEAYIHFAKTFREFVNAFSDECKQILQEKVANFMKGDAYRCKRSLGDIGEFVQILLLADDEFYKKSEVIHALVREAMARQVLWIIKAKAQQGFKSQNEQQEMSFCFHSQRVSIFLFIFVVEVAKSFGKKSYLDSIEADFCVAEEKVIWEFVKKMEDIKKYRVKSYEDWFSYLGLKENEGYGKEDVYQKLIDSFELSNDQGYTFGAGVVDHKKIMKQEEEKQMRLLAKQKKEEEMQAKLKEKKKKMQEIKEKKEQEMYEKVMAFTDTEKQIETQLKKVTEKHVTEKKNYKKQVKNLEKELYEKYFGDCGNDPFAMYRDEAKLKQYEKELKALSLKKADNVVQVRLQESQLNKKVDEIYDSKEQKMQEWALKKQEMENERQKKWEMERKKQQMKWEMVLQERKNAKLQQINLQKELKDQHRKDTNNGLGFDRVAMVQKQEQEDRRVKLQVQREQLSKNNRFSALAWD